MMNVLNPIPLKIISCVLFICLLTSCTSQNIDPVAFDAELEQLLNQKDYFTLQEKLLANEKTLSPERQLYFKVFSAKAFGNRLESSTLIDSLLGNYRQPLADSLALKLLDIKASNHIYTYQYKSASEIYGTILSEYSEIIDSADIDNYKNIQALFGTLSVVGTQKVHLVKDVIIPSKRNTFNHLLSPVTIGGLTEDFIFDTGANFSTITLSQANKMNLKLFEQNIDVGSSTKNTILSTLAVADSLYFGEILFENVVFIVMPDEELTFPELNYAIKGIIGFPVIHQLGEIRLNKNGTITVPLNRTKKGFKNMFFEGLNPVVRAFTENDTLLFTFDTGASHSELSYTYFKKNKIRIESLGERQTNQRGGAGGQSSVDEYILLDFRLKVGSAEAELQSIPVTMEEYDFNAHFDGNLGQDFIEKFQTLILNFEDMYIDFE